MSIHTQLSGSFQPSNSIVTAQHSSLQNPIRARPTGCLLLFHESLHDLSPHPKPVLAACLSTSSTSAAPSQLPATSHSSLRLPRADLFLAPLLSPGRAVPSAGLWLLEARSVPVVGEPHPAATCGNTAPACLTASFSHLGGIAVYTEIGNVIPPTRSF